MPLNAISIGLPLRRTKISWLIQFEKEKNSENHLKSIYQKKKCWRKGWRTAAGGLRRVSKHQTVWFKSQMQAVRKHRRRQKQLLRATRVRRESWESHVKLKLSQSRRRETCEMDLCARERRRPGFRLQIASIGRHSLFCLNLKTQQQEGKYWIRDLTHGGIACKSLTKENVSLLWLLKRLLVVWQVAEKHTVLNDSDVQFDGRRMVSG